jgi:hypothetical protein
MKPVLKGSFRRRGDRIQFQGRFTVGHIATLVFLSALGFSVLWTFVAAIYAMASVKHSLFVLIGFAFIGALCVFMRLCNAVSFPDISRIRRVVEDALRQ